MKADERARHRKIEALMQMLQGMKHDMLAERTTKNKKEADKKYEECAAKARGKKITIVIPEGWPRRGSLLDVAEEAIQKKFHVPKPVSENQEYHRLRTEMDRYLERLHVRLLWDDAAQADQILKEFQEFFEKL